MHPPGRRHGCISSRVAARRKSVRSVEPVESADVRPACVRTGGRPFPGRSGRPKHVACNDRNKAMGKRWRSMVPGHRADGAPCHPAAGRGRAIVRRRWSEVPGHKARGSPSAQVRPAAERCCPAGQRGRRRYPYRGARQGRLGRRRGVCGVYACSAPQMRRQPAVTGAQRRHMSRRDSMERRRWRAIARFAWPLPSHQDSGGSGLCSYGALRTVVGWLGWPGNTSVHIEGSVGLLSEIHKCRSEQYPDVAGPPGEPLLRACSGPAGPSA